MSRTKIMVIVEDPTYDTFFVKPLFKRILADMGRPNAVVETSRDGLAGYAQVTAWASLAMILRKY